MRPESEYEKKVMWSKVPLPFAGIKAGIINLNGIQAHLCVGRNDYKHCPIITPRAYLILKDINVLAMVGRLM